MLLTAEPSFQAPIGGALSSAVGACTACPHFGGQDTEDPDQKWDLAYSPQKPGPSD